VLRGDIYEFRPPKGTGHERRGRRYGVIVQSDALLPRSVVLVAPTSLIAKPASFRPEIDLLGKPPESWWNKPELSTPGDSATWSDASAQSSSGELTKHS
jgi:hypothetical protein